MNFCPFEIKKNLGKTLGLSGPACQKSADFRPIPATTTHLKFQKYGIFRHLMQILRTFFLKKSILVQNRPEMAKNGFWEVL